MIRKIEKAAVIGSSVMGGGIAALLASAGIETLLLDIIPPDLKEDEKNDPASRNRFSKTGLDNAVNAKPPLFMDRSDIERVTYGNIEDDFSKLSECDWIVEAVVENLKIKQDLFARLEKIKKPGAIVSSNTSGLPLEKLSEDRNDEFIKHFLGTHFFNPVRYMKLLEIIPGKETKKEVVDFLSNFTEKRLGKGIVIAKDTPNFIGNRIGAHFICKAFSAVEKNMASIPEIDSMFGPEFGMPKTAVFSLADLIGIDIIGHLSANSYELLSNDEQKEVYKIPQFVKDMISNRLLGKKTKDKGGFYKTDIDPKTWKKIRKVINIKTLQHEEYDPKANIPAPVAAAKSAKTLPDKQKAILFSDDPSSKAAWEIFSSSLVYAANRIPEIADSIVEIDNAMKWGFAWEAGPFEIWDNIGLKESVEKMKSLGIAIPEKISDMIKSGVDKFYMISDNKEFFYDFNTAKYQPVKSDENTVTLKVLKATGKTVKSNKSASLIDIGDGVFNIEFHTRVNAINSEIVDFIPEVLDHVKNYGTGLVIGNQASGSSASFSAGGDLLYMGSLAKAGKFSEIDSFIRKVHENLFALKYSRFPVVAAPYGMTLGGGCEVCLASDRIVAHAETYIGLVEIGAGLLPSGGGCTNLWRKFIESVPGPVNIRDMGPFYIPAFQSIALAKVSASAADARRNGFLSSKDRIVFNRDHLIAEAKKEVMRMVDDGYSPPLKTRIPVMGREAVGMIFSELFNMKNGGFLPPHMEFIAKKIAYVLSGGETKQGMTVTEEYMLGLEREAFVELWKTENTQKMAEHILATGKPMML